MTQKSTDLINFWAIVCKTVRHMLSDRCPVCLSLCPVCPVCNVGVLWPNGWMDQDATWYAGRSGAGLIVLDGDPAPPPHHRQERQDDGPVS